MRSRSVNVRILAAVFLLASASAIAQSTDQMFPTPVRTSEINGTIKARDIGDSRLTTYYYTFEGDQGDLFINIQSSNFTGDIDVYAKEGMRPLTKVVIYADISPQNETGRVVYLRKPETIILRIQGRSPGDDNADFRIKFAGSFAASKAKDIDLPDMPKVDTAVAGSVPVNSVGTRIPSPQEPERPVGEPAATAKKEEAKADKAETPSAEDQAGVSKDERSADADDDAKASKLKVVVTDPTEDTVKPSEPSSVKTAAVPRPRSARTRRKAAPARTAKNVPPPAEGNAADATQPRKEEKKSRPADPMASVRLVVYFKDGSKVERTMSDVLRFSVERAILTVISKDGSIGRYNMIDVQKVSIE